MWPVVPLFKEEINIADKITTANVDSEAREFGRYITPTINSTNKSGGTLSSNFFIDVRFLNKINIRQPAAISQNLVGIRKYAAGWLDL